MNCKCRRLKTDTSTTINGVGSKVMCEGLVQGERTPAASQLGLVSSLMCSGCLVRAEEAALRGAGGGALLQRPVQVPVVEVSSGQLLLQQHRFESHPAVLKHTTHAPVTLGTHVSRASHFTPTSDKKTSAPGDRREMMLHPK